MCAHVGACYCALMCVIQLDVSTPLAGLGRQFAFFKERVLLCETLQPQDLLLNILTQIKFCSADSTATKCSLITEGNEKPT